MIKTLLQFMFETGDSTCRYYSVLVVVKSETWLDTGTLEDGLESFMDSLASDDLEHEDQVEFFMNESGLSWSFVGSTIPECSTIYTLWI